MKKIISFMLYLLFILITSTIIYCIYKHVAHRYIIVSILTVFNVLIVVKLKRDYASSYNMSLKDNLRHMAYHDPLTGLANRNNLNKYINSLISSLKNNKSHFAVIIIDLDFFKNINDTLGHDIGDEILKTVATRLKATVRSNDMVARIGGDEFVIVIRETKNAEALAQIAQKILNNLLQVINVKNKELYITTSIGISTYPFDGNDIETLMKSADMALYRAKENGRNNYQFCTSDMTEKAKQKSARQKAMSHGLVKEEFILYYQPCIDIQTKQIVSVEALLRWQSKEYGLVTPDSIISIAEESGLIVPLSEWVLRTACKQVKDWQKKGYAVNLSVNLAVRQFKDINFIENIIRALKETELSPDFLELEIKESLIMHDPNNTKTILARLKEAGIKIVIDDFGTGFSSFTYFSKNTVDKIKMDKSFIQQLTNSDNDLTVISAMIAMAKRLGIKTVAEGVETQEQYDLLYKEGCDQIQGYFISKPIPVDLMESFFAKQKVKSALG